MLKKFQSTFLPYIAVFLMSFIIFSMFIIGANNESNKEQVYEMTDHTISSKVEQKAEQEQNYNKNSEQSYQPIVTAAAH